MKNKRNKIASEIPRKVGRPCLFDRPMRRWKDRHRVRLWEGEDDYDEEIRAWDAEALRPVRGSNVINLAERRK